jgi:hypothetical protein
MTNRNGSKNQTYINLTLTRPGDVVISYAGGLINAIGLVAAPWSKKSKPSEFGSSSDFKSDSGQDVLTKPIRPKDHQDCTIHRSGLPITDDALLVFELGRVINLRSNRLAAKRD